MKLVDRFHAAVSRGIDPAFDLMERVQNEHPSTILPINLALVAMFPAWMALAVVTNAVRTK